MKLALLVANRGFFPSTVIDSARTDMRAAAKKAGVELLELPENLTRYGAVETTREGRIYADFLHQHRGEYDGLIICLPNFGDENGIKMAVREAGVPVLLQAYPDEIGKMDFANRRDALCGKLALTSVFKQMNFKFTSGLPFVMHPASESFEKELKEFISICRIVKGMRALRIGAFGARTTAFKSVRYDEAALEKHGIDIESVDFSQVFAAYEKVSEKDADVKRRCEQLHQSGDFHLAAEGADIALARLAVTFDRMIADMGLNAIAVRCWNELQYGLRIAPCSVLGLLNQDGIPAVCETDVSNAVMMMALSLAGNGPAGCLDINNNYGDELDKCILFHCGPLPIDLMIGKGEIQEHKMFVKTMGENCSWGVNVGKIRPGRITWGGGRTENGEIQFYVEQGDITDDEIEPEFFGTPGVLYQPGLQEKLLHLSESGFRHHTLITAGNHGRAVREALGKYLNYREIKL
ncbi:MAG: hypothetical protein PUE61_04030 [Clostridiales bacterium]|nr:hypothetical protein [Clostridiales bacterium]